jgi:hypothetical protein
MALKWKYLRRITSCYAMHVSYETEVPHGRKIKKILILLIICIAKEPQMLSNSDSDCQSYNDTIGSQ